MKSYQQLLDEYTPAEIAESFVFPDTRNKQDREEAMMEFRIARRRMAEREVIEKEVQAVLVP
jgi:hypothetical protein